MSTYEEPTWGQDICDLVEQRNEALSPTNPENNPPLPGFDYQLVSPPNMAEIPEWNSPDNAYMPILSEPNSFDLANQVHASGAGGQSAASSAEYNTSGAAQVNNESSSSSVSRAKVRSSDGVTKAKGQRCKELSAKEAEYMKKDDATLTEAELVLKKKAINRLAQRAFRERKESKLKDLQAELLRSETERQKLLEHLEDFKRQFISIKTANQMPQSNQTKNSSPLYLHSPDSQATFIEQMMDGQGHVVDNSTINKVYPEPQNPGRKVLGVGALWDYLQLKREEERYENVDMLDMMELLKGKELCHGYGPAYALDLVEQALETVAARINGSDSS